MNRIILTYREGNVVKKVEFDTVMVDMADLDWFFKRKFLEIPTGEEGRIMLLLNQDSVISMELKIK